MARTRRGCLTVQFQPNGAVEPENSASIPHKKEQEDAKDCRVVVGYKQDVHYEAEWLDSNDEPVAHEKEKMDSNAEYTVVLIA